MPVCQNRLTQHTAGGFTLAELLVVTAILGLLASVVLTNLNKAKIRANDAVRVANLTQLRDALERYHIDHDSYPATFAPSIPTSPWEDPPTLSKLRECSGDEYIPGLVPTYIARLPTDPALDCAGTSHSWVYASNGIDYKLITHVQGQYYEFFIDPAWDGGSADAGYCIIDGSEHVHYGVWTMGAVCWRL